MSSNAMKPAGNRPDKKRPAVETEVMLVKINIAILGGTASPIVAEEANIAAVSST
jgi:hypothetical protein